MELIGEGLKKDAKMEKEKITDINGHFKTLSEKMITEKMYANLELIEEFQFLWKEDVREFIRQVKDECWDESGQGDWVLYNAKEKIDELAGDELVK